MTLDRAELSSEQCRDSCRFDVESCRRAGHVLGILPREVGGDADDVETCERADRRESAIVFGFHTVPAETRGVEGQVRPEPATVCARDAVDHGCVLDSAHPFLDVRRDAVGDLLLERGTQSDEPPAEAAAPYLLGFGVGRDSDDGHVLGEQHREGGVDAMTVGVGFDHRADIDGGTNLSAQRAQIGRDRVGVDLHPHRRCDHRLESSLRGVGASAAGSLSMSTGASPLSVAGCSAPLRP